jgi:fatty-acid desaturase
LGPSILQSKTTTPSNFGLFANNDFQNDIYEWSRDHRRHHKFSETDADPHKSKRSFYFLTSGENNADSWVDVKGDDYSISNNKGSKTLLDGFQVKFKRFIKVFIY